MSIMRALELLREISRRLAMLFRTSSAARELDDELRLHVDLRQAQLMNSGVTAEEARSRAHRQLGNMLAIREDALEVWGWQWLEQFRQDVRYGARSLRKNPIFAAAAILTLGLATGATTAIFSLINGVLLRPLPFESPGRLVQIYGRNWAEDRGGTPDPMTGPVGSLELESAMKDSTSFEGFAGYATTTRHLDRPSGLERVRAVVSDLSFFSVLGADPILGRTFRAEDPPNVAVDGPSRSTAACSPSRVSYPTPSSFRTGPDPRWRARRLTHELRSGFHSIRCVHRPRRRFVKDE
jgi:hypothetical protein